VIQDKKVEVIQLPLFCLFGNHMNNRRNALEWIAIIVAIVCILGAGTLTIAYGFTIGNAITFIIALILIVLGMWMRKMPRWMKRCVTAIIVVGLAFFLSITGIVIRTGTKDTVSFDEDCVIILGCGIRGDVVLPTLQARLDKAMEYIKRNPEAIIIVSGGQGSKEDITEAEAMMRFLLTRGISQERIIKEEASRNTIQNLRNSKDILDRLFFGREYTSAVITSDYHAYRVGMVASDVGIDARSFNANVEWYLRPSAYSREALSVCKYWITR